MFWSRPSIKNCVHIFLLQIGFIFYSYYHRRYFYTIHHLSAYWNASCIRFLIQYHIRFEYLFYQHDNLPRGRGWCRMLLFRDSLHHIKIIRLKNKKCQQKSIRYKLLIRTIRNRLPERIPAGTFPCPYCPFSFVYLLLYY